MRIRVRLFASLRDRFPSDDRGRGEVELDEHATLVDLIERLEIPDPLAQMVLVDGLQEPRSREERARRILEDGQTVSIFPPVAGG
jgi:molybdopterin converting factor small subunit